MSDLTTIDELNPAQRDVVEHLGASREERPVFDENLRMDITVEMQQALAPVVAEIEADDPLHIAKHALATVHGCPRRYIAERDAPFEVSAPMVRGIVSHKAIELGLNWRGDSNPAHLVDEALASLENDEKWVSEFLQTCSEAERAEVRSDALERVSKFEECWPELKPGWKPVTESAMIAELAGGLVVLRGKVDLTIGRPEGMRAGKVLVDFKSGRTMPTHLDDLRFYALVETLRIGTPPRRLATYYLDQGRFVPEDVTVELLRSTAHRVVAGAERIVALRELDSPPAETPGPVCHWCSELAVCESGQRYRADDAD